MTRALVLVLVLVLALAACGPRDACYDAAEAAAQARVDAECPGGVIETCPVAGAIVEELRVAQERCP